ncbi:MAG: hypothetical protein D6710_02315 [Nitrospirae bacterium]|nr:MAG: hypothetical protein D6710_02315 [Nitrospirota bacterium]
MLRDVKPPELSEPIPFSLPSKGLSRAKIALVTTAGVHTKEEPPFDMENPDGDATFREIPSSAKPHSLIITHDYYDHRDADRDINLVFPLERLKELKEEGIVGEVAPRHYSLMGHIRGGLVETLYNETSVEIARRLSSDGVDGVVLTPG